MKSAGWVRIVFLILPVVLLAGCAAALDSEYQEPDAGVAQEQEITSIPPAQFPSEPPFPEESAPPLESEKNFPPKPEEHAFFGTWKLESIVLVSYDYEELRHGINNIGGRRYYEEDYLGYEVEYAPHYFRFGDEVYLNPEYRLSDFPADEYIFNGSLHFSDFYAFIEEHEISIDRADEFETIDDIPLAYFTVDYKEDEEYSEHRFVPVGRGCILLRKDTMLVGGWGKIILARRMP